MNDIGFYEIVVPILMLVIGGLAGFLVGRQQRYSKWRAGYAGRFSKRISEQLDKLKAVESELRGEVSRHIADENKRLHATDPAITESESQSRLSEGR
jgi:hypothetical protein